jgi:hypothetical protein
MNLRPFITQIKPYQLNGRNIYEVSNFKNIPIAELELVKSFLRGKGLKFRIRYRGPRTNPMDIRPKHRRMQDCLKSFANRFTVYIM